MVNRAWTQSWTLKVSPVQRGRMVRASGWSNRSTPPIMLVVLAAWAVSKSASDSEVCHGRGWLPSGRVNGCVMEPAEQDQVVQVGGSAGRPRDHVVGIEMPGLSAAGVSTAVVPDGQCPSLRFGDEAAGAAHVQHLPLGAGDCAEQGAVAGQPGRGGRLNRPDPGDVADRAPCFRRSRGNVFPLRLSLWRGRAG